MTILARPRIYLDVDDTLNAHAPLWGDTQSLTVTSSKGGGYRQLHRFNYSPALVNELETLRHDFDAELVWLTNWLEDGGNALYRLTRKLGKLKYGRKLTIPYPDHNDDLPFGWKTAELISDQATDSLYGPAPFIWADDAEVPLHADEVKTATSGTPSLIIAPDQESGIRPVELAAMRAFLSGLAAA